MQVDQRMSATPPAAAVMRTSPPAAAPAAGYGADVAAAAAAALTDVSAGLVSRVHCTADGHIAFAADHTVMPMLAGDAPSEPPSPAACPPAVCLDVGRRYLAAVLAGVSGGLSGPVEAELVALLHPHVETRIGVSGAAPPGRGLGHFLERLRADNSAYDNWHMTLLSAAAPPAGGEVFLWVDETARNVGPLPGMEAPTNRTSRSLTLHRLFLDASGRITQAWARYQLFEEMRALMLRPTTTTPEPQQQQQPPGDLMEVEVEREEGTTPAAAAPPPPQTVMAGPTSATVSGGGGDDGGAGGRATAPDLTALPFVQRLMGNVATVAAAAASHGLQGEGAAAQSQAAYAVVTAGAPSALAPAGPTGHTGGPSEPTAPPAGAAALHDVAKPLPASGGDAAATSMLPEAASGGLGAGEPPLVPDFEAQAGRSVATWLGLVDSSYAGVRDVFGAVEEEVAVWDAMGLWPHLRGARGRDAVLEELQHLHAEYDIRIIRGSWAVDRAGHVAFCGWEAQAVPLRAEEGTTAAGAAACHSPGRTATAAAPAVAPDAATPAPSAAPPAAGSPLYTFSSLDVYGLSPKGHVTDVVMYRTALPGEAEMVFKKQLLMHHPPASTAPGQQPAAAGSGGQQQQ
ncbi:hypothetical protein PLESTM_001890000 [Pleodorina starrii]|nr:hypothetical protein PLESTM_001890000 [Pleodorina starrii]